MPFWPQKLCITCWCQKCSNARALVASLAVIVLLALLISFNFFGLELADGHVDDELSDAVGRLQVLERRVELHVSDVRPGLNEVVDVDAVRPEKVGEIFPAHKRAPLQNGGTVVNEDLASTKGSTDQRGVAGAAI